MYERVFRDTSESTFVTLSRVHGVAAYTICDSKAELVQDSYGNIADDAHERRRQLDDKVVDIKQFDKMARR